MGRSVWTDSKLKNLERLKASGMNAIEIANELGISRARLYQVLEEHGIDTPKQRQKRRGLSQPEYRIWKNLNAIKHRAEIFDITIEDLLPLPTHCPVLGVELEYFSNGKPTSNSPSIDKLIPSLGYVKGNVYIISYRANRIKNDANVEELNKVVDYINSRLHT